MTALHKGIKRRCLDLGKRHVYVLIFFKKLLGVSNRDAAMRAAVNHHRRIEPRAFPSHAQEDYRVFGVVVCSVEIRVVHKPPLAPGPAAGRGGG